jgi:four helix bundle protein
MRSRPEELRDRTKAFALRIIRLYRSLPFRTDTQVLGKQLLRCGTSVAANYRAVCRARSKAEFIARIGIAAEEADEAVLWIELLTESGIVQPEMTEDLLREARELAAILTASRQTAKRTAQ